MRYLYIARNKIFVAILGVIGTIGQKFITLLQGHPLFEIAELVASECFSGKPYQEVVT